jgi:hypothetical protein
MYLILLLIGVLVIWVSIFYAAIKFVRWVRDEIKCLQCRQRFFKQFED